MARARSPVSGRNATHEPSASAGRTFRAPSFAELHLQQGAVMPNPDLRSEAGTGGDLALVLDGGEEYHVPGILVDVVDTTGCGDSYHGAFLFGLLRGMRLEQTAALASAVAAINTQQLGGRQGLPTYEQVQSFLAARPEAPRD